MIFLTTRPPSAGETTQRQSQRWLEAHGFPLPSVFVVQTSRGRIAHALGLDAVVDDSLENCLDVAAESHAKAILVGHGDPEAVPAAARRRGVRAVASAGEAIDLLETLHDLQVDERVAGSLKRLLRLARKG